MSRDFSEFPTRAARLENKRDRLRVAERRQQETEDQRRAGLHAQQSHDHNRLAFRYNPADNYSLSPHVLIRIVYEGKATILIGPFKGEDVLIPRIPVIPTDTPFQFKRLRFPIRLMFAFTINKAQGQSLELCCLNLKTDCFSHGQLYVAYPRVGKLGNP
ncbi:unnamed protein product [Onchocerca ochengi]|uniref:ATP-dependent DNA helicase n=1 Tax=Onchocerca ochengi TaxID=42157 RepID=A0A182EY46_ONCOC|nr:unnamed protein product [Onchocerca ochengi]